MSATRPLKPKRLYISRVSSGSTGHYPYGSFKLVPNNVGLPPGLFHFTSGHESYLPTLHCQTADELKEHKEVVVSVDKSSLYIRPVLTMPHALPVELINTGHEPLRQGDNFTVQLPNAEDVKAQRHYVKSGQFHRVYPDTVNEAIWGGLLVTRKVNGEGGPVDELIREMERNLEFDMATQLSPYEPEALYSVLSLISSGGFHRDIADRLRTEAAEIANSNNSNNAHRLSVVLNNNDVKVFLNSVLRCAVNILGSVQGFAVGQVLRSASGYNESIIHTGDRFSATVLCSRWLS